MSLKVNNPTKGRKYLLFSSTGQYAQVAKWLSPNRDYDIWLTHYGAQVSPFEEKVEFINYRKGGKFQNLKYAMSQWPELFNQYDYIWITDDDIGLKAKSIGGLFRLMEKYELTAAQPAFDRLGKISFSITVEQPKNILRYSNFIEMTCPVVRTESLLYFMDNFDDRLTGYGTDWLMAHYLLKLKDSKIAVIDAIRCHNPNDRLKGGQREIDKLQPHQERRVIFEQVKRDHELVIDTEGPLQLGVVANKNMFAVSYRLFRQIVLDKLIRRARWLLQDLHLLPKVK